MYDEVRKTAIGKGDDYAVGCFLDFIYFKNDYKIVCCNLSRQNILDSDPRSIQQIEFVYRLDDNKFAQVLTVL